MKKTKIVAVKMKNTNSMIEELEEKGFEIIEFKHEIANNGDIYILLKAYLKLKRKRIRAYMKKCIY